MDKSPDEQEESQEGLNEEEGPPGREAPAASSSAPPSPALCSLTLCHRSVLRQAIRLLPGTEEVALGTVVTDKWLRGLSWRGEWGLTVTLSELEQLLGPLKVTC